MKPTNFNEPEFEDVNEPEAQSFNHNLSGEGDSEEGEHIAIDKQQMACPLCNSRKLQLLFIEQLDAINFGMSCLNCGYYFEFKVNPITKKPEVNKKEINYCG